MNRVLRRPDPAIHRVGSAGGNRDGKLFDVIRRVSRSTQDPAGPPPSLIDLTRDAITLTAIR